VPVVDATIKRTADEYFALVDPAVDQLIRSFYDNNSA